MSGRKYRVVDRVGRETAELLEENDESILAYDDPDVYVLEEKDDE